jgi:hypothetical protein
VPRHRSLKPSIWTSKDVVRLSVVGRLVFIVMITQADDEGRLHTDAHHLATVHLPGSGVTTIEVASQLKLMQRLGMVQPYRDHENQTCFAILNWSAHQRIDHPTSSRIQAPPVLSRPLARIRADSTGKDGRREKDGRMEGDTSPVARTLANGSALALLDSDDLTPRQLVFQAWVEATQRTGRTQLDAKRSRLIDIALASYALPDCLDAVRGWRFSPHHRGENDRATIYNDIELLLRDAKHIEFFRDLERSGGSESFFKRAASQLEARGE